MADLPVRRVLAPSSASIIEFSKWVRRHQVTKELGLPFHPFREVGPGNLGEPGLHVDNGPVLIEHAHLDGGFEIILAHHGLRKRPGAERAGAGHGSVMDLDALRSETARVLTRRRPCAVRRRPRTGGRAANPAAGKERACPLGQKGEETEPRLAAPAGRRPGDRAGRPARFSWISPAISATPASALWNSSGETSFAKNFCDSHCDS